jgi:hypothetical protein
MSRSSRLTLFVGLACAVLLAIGLLLIPNRHSSLRAATVSVDKTPAKPAPAADANTAAAIAPPGTILYAAKKGDTVPGLLHKFLWQSTYMTGPEFEAAIRERNANFKGVFLKAGQNYVIPGMEGLPATEKPVVVPRDYEVRAIYLTGLMAASTKGVEIVKQWRKVGGNAVVFDVKDSDGWVNIPWDNPLEPPSGHQPYIKNLVKYTHFLHSMGMHAIARVAIFRDEALVVHHPELAVHSRKTGEPWRENGKLVWTDTSNPKVQEYDIALAKHATESGVDEVQFDYVRFPAEGDQKDAKFYYESEHPKWQRSDVITDFLTKAYAELHPTGVLLSLDVFGVMAWQRGVDLSHTGQDIPNMAKHADVISPMIYPSHFFGMDGIANPGDAPEHFIGESMERFQKITADTHVVLRPWLQAFAWRTKTYSPEYIRVQVATSKSKSGIGFLFWNARNDYSKPYVAMPEMAKDPAKFFRGDEFDKLPKPAVAAAAIPVAQGK